MSRGLRLAIVAVIGLMIGFSVAANEPMFVRWLIADDPGDQTIRVYWEASKDDRLTPEGLVDLGTMLFYRGYPKDAVRLFRRALGENSDLYEAWFRIGLVEHREGNHHNAEVAYRKCLKLLTGHGWCNFYMGLLCEQTGRPSKALHYYRRAFKFAPELSDPAVNPEILASELALGAIIRHRERQRFSNTMPMPFLEADKVDAVRKRFEHELKVEAGEGDTKAQSPEPPPPAAKTATRPATTKTEDPRAAKTPRPRLRPVPRTRGGQQTEAPPGPEAEAEAEPTPAPIEEGDKILPRVPSVSREALLPPLNDPFRRG